jgi:hypothetical protein
MKAVGRPAAFVNGRTAVALFDVGPCTYRTCLPRRTSLFETTERLAGARCVKRRTHGEGEGLVAPVLGRFSISRRSREPRYIYSGLSLLFTLWKQSPLLYHLNQGSAAGSCDPSHSFLRQDLIISVDKDQAFPHQPHRHH